MIIFIVLILWNNLSGTNCLTWIPASQNSSFFQTGKVSSMSPSASTDYAVSFSPALNWTPTQALLCTFEMNFKNNLRQRISFLSASMTGLNFRIEVQPTDLYVMVSLNYFIKNQNWNEFDFSKQDMNQLSFVNNITSSDTYSVTYKYNLQAINNIFIQSIEAYINFPSSSDFSSIQLLYNNVNLTIKVTKQVSITHIYFAFIKIKSGDKIFKVQHISTILPSIPSLAAIDEKMKYYFFWVKFQYARNVNMQFTLQVDEEGVELIIPHNYVAVEVLTIRVKLCENATYKYLIKNKMECHNICPEKYFTDVNFNVCLDCLDNCLICVNGSGCEECEEGYQFIEGECVFCKMVLDPGDPEELLCFPVEEQPEEPQEPVEPQQPEEPFQPQEPQQPFQPEQPEQPEQPSQLLPICITGHLNNLTKHCQIAPAAQTLTQTLAVLKSIPAFTTVTNVFTSLFVALDDFSYYSYHKRNYSDNVVVFLTLMTNFTLMRFLPPFVSNIYKKLQFSFKSLILKQDLGKTPQKFKDIDEGVYFIKNTQSFYLGTIPLACLTFLSLFLLNKLVSIWMPNSFLSIYKYPIMIIFDIFNGNTLFFSFNFFKQFYQSVPIGAIGYANIIINSFSFLLFLIGICSLYSILRIYLQTSQQFIIHQIYNQIKPSWIIIQGLLSIFLGFVHASLYQHGQLQSILLFTIFISKLTIYIIIHSNYRNTIRFTFEIVSMSHMICIQLLFVIQYIVIKRDEYGQVLQINMGNYEIIIIVSFLIGKIGQIIFEIVKRILVLTIRKFRKWSGVEDSLPSRKNIRQRRSRQIRALKQKTVFMHDVVIKRGAYSRNSKFRVLEHPTLAQRSNHKNITQQICLAKRKQQRQKSTKSQKHVYFRIGKTSNTTKI